MLLQGVLLLRIFQKHEQQNSVCLFINYSLILQPEITGPIAQQVRAPDS